ASGSPPRLLKGWTAKIVLGGQSSSLTRGIATYARIATTIAAAAPRSSFGRNGRGRRGGVEIGPGGGWTTSSPVSLCKPTWVRIAEKRGSARKLSKIDPTFR